MSANDFFDAPKQAETRISILKNPPAAENDARSVAPVVPKSSSLVDEVSTQPALRPQPVVKAASGVDQRPTLPVAVVREPKRYHLMNKKGRVVGPISAREVVALFLKGLVDRSFVVLKNETNSRVPIEKFVMVYAREENGGRRRSFEVAEPSKFNSLQAKKTAPFKRVIDTGQILAKAYLERERLTRLAYAIAFFLIIAAVTLALYSARLDLQEQLSPLAKKFRAKIEQNLNRRAHSEGGRSRQRSEPERFGLWYTERRQSESKLSQKRDSEGRPLSGLRARHSLSSGELSHSQAKSNRSTRTRPQSSKALELRDPGRESRSLAGGGELQSRLALNQSQRQVRLQTEAIRREREQRERLRRSISRRQLEEKQANLARAKRSSSPPRENGQRFVAVVPATKPAPASPVAASSTGSAPPAVARAMEAGPRVDTLVDGQQVTQLGPMRFDREQIRACEAACAVTFSGGGGVLQVKFFKAVWGSVLLNKTGGVYLSGLVRKGGAGTTLMLSNVQ